jgi:hypothetical protein
MSTSYEAPHYAVFSVLSSLLALNNSGIHQDLKYQYRGEVWYKELHKLLFYFQNMVNTRAWRDKNMKTLDCQK